MMKLSMVAASLLLSCGPMWSMPIMQGQIPLQNTKNDNAAQRQRAAKKQIKAKRRSRK